MTPTTTSSCVVEPLARHRHLLPTLQGWFEAEWPGWYGPGGRGNAGQDLSAYANEGALPVGVVALRDGQPCGFAAIKQGAFPTHPHLAPWIGAACVPPPLRRQGIGQALLLSLEPLARHLGHHHVYCATATSHTLLLRCGWRLIEHAQHEGEALGIYEKAI